MTEPALIHKPKTVCAKCGQDWPCDDRRELPGLCTAMTAAGKPCSKPICERYVVECLCGTHGRQEAWASDAPMSFLQQPRVNRPTRSAK